MKSKIRALYSYIADHFPDLADLLVMAGAVLISVGLWQIYRPAAYLALGVIMLSMGIMAAFKK